MFQPTAQPHMLQFAPPPGPGQYVLQGSGAPSAFPQPGGPFTVIGPPQPQPVHHAMLQQASLLARCQPGRAATAQTLYQIATVDTPSGPQQMLVPVPTSQFSAPASANPHGQPFMLVNPASPPTVMMQPGPASSALAPSVPHIPCRDFRVGRCVRGEQCRFGHFIPAVPVPPPPARRVATPGTPPQQMLAGQTLLFAPPTLIATPPGMPIAHGGSGVGVQRFVLQPHGFESPALGEADSQLVKKSSGLVSMALSPNLAGLESETESRLLDRSIASRPGSSVHLRQLLTSPDSLHPSTDDIRGGDLSRTDRSREDDDALLADVMLDGQLRFAGPTH